MIHHVYANRSNVGDWLSAHGIRALLAPEEVVEHLCDEHFVDATLERLAAADSDDLVVIGGGGLFMDYFRPFWEGLLEIDAPPFVIWGAGVCDLKREASTVPRGVLARVVGESVLCVVRDTLTLQFLPKASGAQAVPCPALAGLEPQPAAGSALLHSVHKFAVGVDAYEATNAALDAFATETGRERLEVDNRIPPNSRAAYRAVLAKYAEAELVVSSRLHGCIIAVAMGRKVLAVSGDRKVEAFMQAAGLAEWVCDLHDLRSLPARLEGLPDQRRPLRFVEEARRANHAVARQVKALSRAATEPGPVHAASVVAGTGVFPAP